MKTVAFAASTDLDRSRAFFEQVVGLKFLSQDGYACVFSDAAGTLLRVSRVPTPHTPAQYTIAGWEVPDVPAAVAALESRGCVFESYPWAGGKVWTAPGGSQVAWFKDPDGNVLSLSSH